MVSLFPFSRGDLTKSLFAIDDFLMATSCSVGLLPLDWTLGRELVLKKEFGFSLGVVKSGAFLVIAAANLSLSPTPS